MVGRESVGSYNIKKHPPSPRYAFPTCSSLYFYYLLVVRSTAGQLFRNLRFLSPLCCFFLTPSLSLASQPIDLTLFDHLPQLSVCCCRCFSLYFLIVYDLVSPTHSLIFTLFTGKRWVSIHWNWPWHDREWGRRGRRVGWLILSYIASNRRQWISKIEQHWSHIITQKGVILYTEKRLNEKREGEEVLVVVRIIEWKDIWGRGREYHEWKGSQWVKQGLMERMSEWRKEREREKKTKRMKDEAREAFILCWSSSSGLSLSLSSLTQLLPITPLLFFSLSVRFCVPSLLTSVLDFVVYFSLLLIWFSLHG